MLFGPIPSSAIVALVAVSLLLFWGRARLESHPAYLHLLLMETALGFAIAIFAEGWSRWIGFGVGIVSVFDCAHFFSKTAPKS